MTFPAGHAIPVLNKKVITFEYLEAFEHPLVRCFS